MKSAVLFRCLALVLLVTGVLCMSRTFAVKIPAPFQERNAVFLEDSFERALTGFGVLSGIKAGLAVLEGSTGGVSAGVSVQLQVGDLVQAAYDYVDVAWRALLFGCLSLLSIQILLEALDVVSVLLLGFCMFLAGIRLLLSGSTFRSSPLVRLSSDALTGTAFLMFLTLILLPGSVQISSLFSEHLTQPALTEASEGFAEAAQELFPDGEESPRGLWDQVRSVSDQLEYMTALLRERSRQWGEWTVQLVVGYVFDCFLFPLGSFLFLGWGSRSAWRSLMQEKRFQLLIAEIRGRQQD